MRMKLQARDEQRALELKALLGNLQLDAPRALPQALPAIQELIGADRALALGIGMEDARSVVDFVETSGIAAEPFAKAFGDFLERVPVNWTHWSAARPDPKERNRPLSVFERIGRAIVEELPVYKQVLTPFGLRGQDQLRVLVCDGASLLAWIGGFRADAFTPYEESLFKTVVPALQRRLKLEAELDAAPAASLALAAAMEHISGQAWVLDARGNVRHANSAGRAALDASPGQTRLELRTVVRAAEAPPPGFKVTPLGAPGQRVEYLVIRRSDDDASRFHVDAAARRWRLTPRQSEVLHRLARGMSNKAIAAEFGCALRTIELHVTAILARAQVPGRAALVAQVFAAR